MANEACRSTVHILLKGFLGFLIADYFNALADVRGRQACVPPWGSKLFHFHVIFGNKAKLAHHNLGVATPTSGKSWICHCYVCNGLTNKASNHYYSAYLFVSAKCDALQQIHIRPSTDFTDLLCYTLSEIKTYYLKFFLSCCKLSCFTFKESYHMKLTEFSCNTQ